MTSICMKYSETEVYGRLEFCPVLVSNEFGVLVSLQVCTGHSVPFCANLVIYWGTFNSADSFAEDKPWADAPKADDWSDVWLDVWSDDVWTDELCAVTPWADAPWSDEPLSWSRIIHCLTSVQPHSVRHHIFNRFCSLSCIHHLFFPPTS